LAIAGMDRMIYGAVSVHRLMLIRENLSEDSIGQTIKEHRLEDDPGSRLEPAGLFR